MNMTPAEKMMYCTLRIEMVNSSNVLVGAATGFLFQFCVNSERYIPALVTNRHVADDCDYVRLTFTRAGDGGTPETGTCDQTILITANAIRHPNPKIDLCIMLIGENIKALAANGTPPFFTVLEQSLIPSADVWENLDAIENVTMIGYPRGWMDGINNLPIFRRGITATHPAFDFQGEPKFLVDMACLPGSSGSPVFLYNVGSHSDPRNNRLILGSQIFLLGVQYAAPTAVEVGELIELPSAEKHPAMKSFNNLGLIIKSTELLAFDSILHNIFD